MGGGGDAGAAAPAESATPATTGSAPAEAAPATPAPAPVEAPPAEPEPTPPWVEAAQRRRKIPFWAVPVVAALPLWVVLYALTNDPPTPTEPGPLALGEEVYSTNCAGCHGASGGGAGANPALTGDDATPLVFPSPAEQVRWVSLGTNGYRSAGLDTYGEGSPRTVGGRGTMPPWMDSLSAEQLMAVVLYERAGLNDEAFDAEVWQEGFEEQLSELLPEDKVAEYVAVLEEWAADPPA